MHTYNVSASAARVSHIRNCVNISSVTRTHAHGISVSATGKELSKPHLRDHPSSGRHMDGQTDGQTKSANYLL